MTRLADFAGPGLVQVGELAVAFVLSALVGLERELRQKSAGLRTHTLVGLGSALFVLISKYGFDDVLRDGIVRLDPSRVAAQIVSGIGFLGGGLIFVRRDAVRGLTTAATIWLTAAIGAAAGAGLALLAVVCTVAHFATVYGLGAIGRRLPRSRSAPSAIRLTYRNGAGALRAALVAATRQGFSVAEVSIESGVDVGTDVVAVVLQVVGTGPVADLAAALAELPGVLSVSAGDVNEPTE